VAAWAADPAGGNAVRAFLANNPAMGPYLVGKSYWEPGGVPPLESENDDYFKDIESGVRQAMPFGAWRTRESIRNNEYDRQLMIKHQYGDDPYEVASLTIGDPETYNELTQEFTQKHAMFMWEDQLRGSEYTNWKERNREDQFSIREEGIRKYNDMNQTISDTIQMLEVTPLLNGAERKETTDGLKAMKAGISDFIEEMRTEDTNYDFLSGWQQLRIRWFDEGYSPYLDALGEQYDKMDDAETEVEMDRIWAAVANVEETIGAREVIIDGHRFPPPATFKWNNKDPEVREASLLKSVTYKAAWLDAATTDRVLEMSPELEKYLPSTPKQRAVFDEYNQWYDEIEKRYAGNTGITYNDRKKQRDNLDEQLRGILLADGESDQLTWLDMWPVQKLNEAKQLPDRLQNSELIEQVNAIQRARAAEGYKSVGENDPGRRALTRTLRDRIAADPIFRAQLVEIGIQLYGEELPEAIIPKLFFNDSY